jgi:hypothetical protein
MMFPLMGAFVPGKGTQAMLVGERNRAYSSQRWMVSVIQFYAFAGTS